MMEMQQAWFIPCAACRKIIITARQATTGYEFAHGRCVGEPQVDIYERPI